MGKSKWRRGKQQNNGGGGRERGESYEKKKDGYDIIIKKNEHFEKYYRQLGLVPEAEYDKFLDILKQPLPITFRITSYKSFAGQVLHTLKEKHFKYIDELTRTNRQMVIDGSANKGASLIIAKLANQESSLQESDDQADEIYKCLPWYPNQLAWQVNMSRQDVRKNVHFDNFKQFLINQTENGNINRQEAVSMLPPLVLDVQPHHKILDMCASPGSKTAQLIEFLHSDSTVLPEGFVIANDLENKRCYMLMHQLKRLESANFMIINQDASSLPNFRVDLGESSSFASVAFDRILADVPCSGDGTFRKNIDVWTKWNFAHACNLHGIQSRIAKRAAELLQYGGLMVYSTCSLNPVENEAVVYNLLLKFKDQLELVDVRDKLQGLKSVHGLLKWNLMAKNGQIFDNVEQVASTEYVHLLKSYMFPPEEHVARELGLDKCIRILPHHQNTGGFFIAVMRKLPLVKQVDMDANYLTSTGESGQVKSSDPPEADQSRVMKAPPAKRLKHVFAENPFQFFDTNEQLRNVWTRIKEFYGVSDDFPCEQMLTRNKQNESIRNIYFVSKQIRELTINNGDRFKFINMGIALFSGADMKDPTNVEFRISQEGVDVMARYMTKRIVEITDRKDLIKILSESNPLVFQLSQSLQEQISQKCTTIYGSFILTANLANVKTTDEPADRNSVIRLVCWLGKTSVRPLLNIQTRSFFLTIIGVDQQLINDSCNKIKEEDRINSARSLKTNPQYIAKHPSASAENTAKDETAIDENEPQSAEEDQTKEELIE